MKDRYESTPATGTDQQKPLVLHGKRPQERRTLSLYPKPSTAGCYRLTSSGKHEVAAGAGHEATVFGRSSLAETAC